MYLLLKLPVIVYTMPDTLHTKCRLKLVGAKDPSNSVFYSHQHQIKISEKHAHFVKLVEHRNRLLEQDCTYPEVACYNCKILKTGNQLGVLTDIQRVVDKEDERKLTLAMILIPLATFVYYAATDIVDSINNMKQT